MTPQSSPHGVPPARGRKARLGMILGGLSVVAASLVIRHYWGAEAASAGPSGQRTARTSAARPAKATSQRSRAAHEQRSAKTASDGSSVPKVVAVVNRRQITRDDLARECLRHYGKRVLESLTNKLLISQQCKRRNIVVSQAEVDAEIQRKAQRFGLPTEQWLKMLKQERGIDPAQYANDIVWPTLALRRLAGEQLTVSQDELVRAYETRYGAAVDVRLIACKSRSKAEQVHSKAVAVPGQFGELAKQYSEDASASVKGRTQPIRKHGSYQEIEQAAFQMKDGEISKVIPAGGQYVILKRERLLPGPKAVDFQRVAPQLEEIIRDGKMRSVASSIFQRLQKESKVVNVFNDPVKRREMPGVAAIINGHKVTVLQLAEQCIQRHSTEVLEGTINRTLIEIACQKQKITVTEQDVDREIVRAASDSLPPKDGKPDVGGWLKLVTQKQGVSVDVYRHDAVWPSVALKKLVGNTVNVAPEDLKKGYEANYGSRVRCRAIVLSNLRIAQRVWEKARANCTVEYFGELAAEYSIEPGSRALRGEWPPIQRHGGQPLLEKEAFSLSEGELSGIIQVDDRYIILLCEGYTKPTVVDFEKVRPLIHEDIYEKKQRVAMAEHFQHLQDTATIDNYLEGTSRSPKRPARLKPPAQVPKLRQVPAR